VTWSGVLSDSKGGKPSAELIHLFCKFRIGDPLKSTSILGPENWILGKLAAGILLHFNKIVVIDFHIRLTIHGILPIMVFLKNLQSF